MATKRLSPKEKRQLAAFEEWLATESKKPDFSYEALYGAICLLETAGEDGPSPGAWQRRRRQIMRGFHSG